MARGFTDRDHGYKQLLTAFKAFAGTGGQPPQIVVGVREGAGAEADGTSLVLVAAVNEFGSSDGHVPERSFLRSTIDENRAAYETDMGKALVQVILGKGSLRTEFGKVGAKVAGDVQRKITTLDTPPNAPSTIRQKGSSNPLIDSGALRAAIDFELKGV